MSKRSSFSRIDENVYFTMAGLCLLGLIIVGFRYAGKTVCGPVKIAVRPGSMQENDPVRFSVETKDAQSITWDFGDGVTVDEKDFQTTHIYKQPGRYTIKVTVNGSCEEFAEVKITDKPEVINTGMLPTFIFKDTALINEPVTFEDTSSRSTSWEWRFEKDGPVAGFTRKVQHRYQFPGRKTITLKVNGRADMVMYAYIDVIDPKPVETNNNAKAKGNAGNVPKVIIVPSDPTVPPITIQEPGPKQPDPKPDNKPKFKPISPGEMSGMLMGVNEGSNTFNSFTEFLCNTNLVVNYEGKSMSFAQLCDELKRIKKGKIKRINVKIFRDGETNCINSMEVDVKKKFL